MKVGIKLGKVKKFGIGWCIPHRMAAGNAKHPPHLIGLIFTNDTINSGENRNKKQP